MTPLDFITDHLVNIDSVFDKHDNGDEQKPHSPVEFNNAGFQLSFITQPIKIALSKSLIDKTSIPVYNECFFPSGYTPYIFRPPIG